MGPLIVLTLVLLFLMLRISKELPLSKGELFLNYLFDKLNSSKSYWILTLVLFFLMLRIFKNCFFGTLISMILYDFILLDASHLEGLFF